MKTKGFSIGIIFLLLMVCTTCTKDEALLTQDGELSALKSAHVENAEFTTVFGPEVFTRSKGKPVLVTQESQIEDSYVLESSTFSKFGFI